jgi:hypothetical protein
VVAVLVWCRNVESGDTPSPVLTAYNHFAKPLAASENGISLTGGRLVKRDLAYLAHSGIKSVVSIFKFETNTTWKGVAGEWLSSDDQVIVSPATIPFCYHCTAQPPPLSLSLSLSLTGMQGIWDGRHLLRFRR